MQEKACRRCRYITSSSECPSCGSKSLSEEWLGVVVVVDPSGSEIARKLKIKKPGRYALVVR